MYRSEDDDNNRGRNTRLLWGFNKLFFNQTLRTVSGIITALNKSYLFKSFEWNRLEWYVWVIISSFSTFSLSGTPINPEQDL